MRTEFVYFILDTLRWRIKIGRAIDVERRLREHQLTFGEHLVVLGTIHCDYDARPRLETAILQRFADDLIENEWFRPSATLWEFIGDHHTRPDIELFNGAVRYDELPPRLQAMVPAGEEVWIVASKREGAK